MLERYVDERRIQAASLVAFGAAIPPALPLGLAAASLTTLRRGPVDGAVVVLLGLGLVALLLLATGGGVGGLGTLALALAVAIGLADVLRRSGSLSVALQAGVLASLGVLVAMLLAIGDQQAYWSDLFTRTLDRMMAQGSGLTPEQRDRWLAEVPFQALSGFIVGLMTLLIWIGLFLGRAWQARLVNPGGFGEEFRELGLGRILAFASAATFFAYAAIGAVWLLNVAALVLHVWIIQGLSYLHWTVARGDPARRSLWLVLSYGLLGLFWITGNPLAILVPLAGMLGEIVDYRGLVRRRAGRRRGD